MLRYNHSLKFKPRFQPITDLSKSFASVEGTDEGHEGTWTFSNNETQLPFVSWCPGFPTNGAGYSHCMFVSSDYSDGVVDANCDFLAETALCETEVYP